MYKETLETREPRCAIGTKTRQYIWTKETKKDQSMFPIRPIEYDGRPVEDKSPSMRSMVRLNEARVIMINHRSGDKTTIWVGGLETPIWEAW